MYQLKSIDDDLHESKRGCLMHMLDQVYHQMTMLDISHVHLIPLEIHGLRQTMQQHQIMFGPVFYFPPQEILSLVTFEVILFHFEMEHG